MTPRIVIVGGYGAFGAHVAERLSRDPDLDIVIAGRSLEKANKLAAQLARVGKAKTSGAVLDATTARATDVKALGARVLVNSSGPFQTQDYALARACIEAGCHYVDLADARAFVAGIAQLDREARDANLCVISGASSVPGLSTAVVNAYADKFQSLEAVEIGISPGNSFNPGKATIASILGQVGKPFALRLDGRVATEHGWQGLARHDFPKIGSRLLCDVEVPDLDLLPEHYPQLRTARFKAGLEVGLFHIGLWGLSWLVRAGLVTSLAPLAGPLLHAKEKLHRLGTDCGGMFVTLSGRSLDGNPHKITWHLIARSGHGPYVPAIASVILAKRLAAGTGPPPGARACFALFTPADFEAEVTGLNIVCTTDHCSAAS